MKFWQVDAFTSEIFTGNPAAVFIFTEEPEKAFMMKIAHEMNLSETAFVIIGPEMRIRWFTPNTEVNLCGHATLSAAHILWQQEIIAEEKITFQSKSGALSVSKSGNSYTLDFPLQPAIEKPEYTNQVTQLIHHPADFIGSNGEDFLVVIANDANVFSFAPDFDKISAFPERGFLLTAHDSSGHYDYIYRAFFPKLDVPEDPVTGSANTCLAPYWAKRLNKTKLLARQVSDRGGDLSLEVGDDRVQITGQAITVFEGNINIPSEKLVK